MKISYLSDNLFNLPHIEKTNDIDVCCPIVIIDTDCITEERQFKINLSNRLHIGYITSPKLLGWDHIAINTFFHKMNGGVFAASEYLQNQLAFLQEDIGLLNMPVLDSLYKPNRTKEKKIVVVADKNDLSSNLLSVMDVFNMLKPQGFEYSITPANSPALPLVLSNAWGYINMSRSSRYHTDFIEAGLCGCWCFVWSFHAFADKYPVHRFEDIAHGAELINDAYNSSQGKANTDIRKVMVKRHGYNAFKKSLKSIVDKNIFV